MNIEIQLTREAIPMVTPKEPEGCGAWAEFRGLVRGQENGAAIAALEYEAYSPMAENQMRRILEEIAARHTCLTVRVVHRTGIVPVGEAAIYVGVAGTHRAEALAMLSEFMDRLKQDVPIWKTRALELLPEEISGTAHGIGARTFLSASGSAVSTLADKNVRAPYSAAEVIRLLREICNPLDAENVPLGHALGRVLRQSVIAPEAQPPFDRSSVDGYAVGLDDRSASFRVVDEIRAGEWKPRTLALGESVRIATGGAVPSSGLQVIMKEDVRVEDGVMVPLRRDEELNIRFTGEDAAAGQELVPSGTILQHGTLGLLASVGCVHPLVSRLPKVLHIATGNEIVGAEQSPAPGQVRDSNSVLVRAFLEQWNITPEQERAGEEEAAIWEKLEKNSKAFDLLLISGGASVGEHDFTRRILERAGFSIHVARTTARPGKPLVVARRGNTLAFGLPGNPLAHFVCLNLYVRAAIEAWSGQTAVAAFERGLLNGNLETGGNHRETFWPAFWQLRNGRAEVTPLRWSSSGDLTSLSMANALIRVPGSNPDLQSRSEIEFLPTCRRF
jgi:molybdopterin molybdotransferase